MLEGKSYTSSFNGRKLVSAPQESSSHTTHFLVGFNEIEVQLRIYGMGWTIVIEHFAQ